MKRAVFLDRDGVLNEAIVLNGRAVAPLTVDEFRLVSDAARHVRRLREAGLVCIVVTNQPELARGTLRRETLDAMHTALTNALAVDDIYLCPHEPADDCRCHKPRFGMLLDAAAKWRVDLAESFVIGDRWRDIEAGQAVDCYTVLIERDYSQCRTADARVADLGAAVDHVLGRLGTA